MDELIIKYKNIVNNEFTKYPKWKIYEYLTAIELNMILWEDAIHLLNNKIPHSADYGIDLISYDLTRTAQVKYYNNTTITWRNISTYISYSTKILGINNMLLITTTTAKIPKIVQENINIVRYNFDEILNPKPKINSINMLCDALKKYNNIRNH